MFDRLTKIGILSFASLSTLTLVFIGWPRESDREAYRKTLEQSRAFSKSAPPICQDRRSVCKDIWFSEGTERLHYRIESETSSLNLHSVRNKVEVVEQLHGLRCWMQDKVNSAVGTHGSNQQTRYFTANEGVYHFLSQSLLAQQASLSLYRLPGEHLPEIGKLPSMAPFLSGNAERIKLHVSGKTPMFQAFNFKASMNPVTE